MDVHVNLLLLRKKFNASKIPIFNDLNEKIIFILRLQSPENGHGPTVATLRFHSTDFLLFQFLPHCGTR